MSGDRKESLARVLERRVVDDRAIFADGQIWEHQKNPAQNPEASLLAWRRFRSPCTRASGVHLQASAVLHHPRQHEQHTKIAILFVQLCLRATRPGVNPTGRRGTNACSPLEINRKHGRDKAPSPQPSTTLRTLEKGQPQPAEPRTFARPGVHPPN